MSRPWRRWRGDIRFPVESGLDGGAGGSVDGGSGDGRV